MLFCLSTMSKYLLHLMIAVFLTYFMIPLFFNFLNALFARISAKYCVVCSAGNKGQKKNNVYEILLYSVPSSITKYKDI